MEQLLTYALTAITVAFLAEVGAAAVCGARSAPVGSTSGALPVAKCVWCLGPCFAAAYLLAGGLVAGRCAGDERLPARTVTSPVGSTSTSS